MKTLIASLISALVMLCSCSMAEQQQPQPIRVLAPDGAWTWFNDERTIVDGSRLIIGSLDSQGVSRVDVYDMDTGDTQACPLSSWKSLDDHNNPALLKLSDGSILACYSQHGRQRRWYWRIAEESPQNEGMLQWGSEQRFRVPAGTTYCNLVQLSDENGRIYNFSRNVNFNPNIQFSDDMAHTWQGPMVFLKTGDGRIRPYVKYADNGKDRIDFLYTDGHPRNEPVNNVYHMYYQKGAFFKSDGTPIKTMQQVREQPIQPNEGTLIYDGSTHGRGWVWDIEYDQDGTPVCVFINSVDHGVGNDLRYRYARWDPASGQWNQQQIAFAGTHLYDNEQHYAGGITIDPANVNTVYISCDVDPETGEKNTTGRYQIYAGQTTNGGVAWSWKQLTFDTDQDNLRPIVPRDHGCKRCLVWFQGEYRTYTDYKTRIVGLIER